MGKYIDMDNYNIVLRANGICDVTIFQDNERVQLNNRTAIIVKSRHLSADKIRSNKILRFYIQVTRQSYYVYKHIFCINIITWHTMFSDINRHNLRHGNSTKNIDNPLCIIRYNSV